MESGKNGGFHTLDEKSLVEYIKSTSPLLSRLGGEAELEHLTIKEVGDGNLNFVYIVTSRKGSFVAKQALPYIRCVGDSWPMTKERAYFEALTLTEHGRLCPEHVPEVYHFDRSMSLIGMRYLEPPHIILRKGLIAGIEYPLLAQHMSDYIAKTLFFTSLLYHTTADHKKAGLAHYQTGLVFGADHSEPILTIVMPKYEMMSVALLSCCTSTDMTVAVPGIAEFCGNVEMCRLTEQVVFSDPYRVSNINRWTSPYLDQDAKSVREDDELKFQIAELKSMFCERAQALIHGDLHTGSVMVTTDSTQVIDPEFGFYAPMGFDIGAFLGNLILAYFSQDGHATETNDRKAYKEWILNTIEETWRLFEKKFCSLWDLHKNGNGEVYPLDVYNNAELLCMAQKKYMNNLFHDSLGFGAAKMIRRIFGIAHVEDFESIKDESRRASCERRALNVAKVLLKGRQKFDTIGQVISAIREGSVQ